MLPGVGGTYLQHERCGRCLRPPVSSQSSPSPGVLRGCEGGCHRGHSTPLHLGDPSSTPPHLHPAPGVCTRAGSMPRGRLCCPCPVPLLGGFPLALGSVWGRHRGAQGEAPAAVLPPQLHLCEGDRDRYSWPWVSPQLTNSTQLPPSIPLLPLGKAPRRGRSRVYRSRL